MIVVNKKIDTENTMNNDNNHSVIQAEKMLLGAILADHSKLDSVRSFLRVEHFYIGLYGKIYKSIECLVDSGLDVSPITVSSVLEMDKEFHDIGGVEHLRNLLTIAIVVFNVQDYGRIVYDAAMKRKLIDVASEVIENASDFSVLKNVQQQIEYFENKIYHLANNGVVDGGFVECNKLTAKVLENIAISSLNSKSILGISTGFYDLNSKLGGFHNSDLIIIAGRPAMGKTAFALGLALNACNDMMVKGTNRSVGFFSLEMSSVQLMNRLISIQSGVNSSAFLTGKINEENYNKIRIAIGEINKLPLFIDDTPSLTISAIRSRARKLKRQNNLGILFIDYLQLLKCTEKVENRTLEITEITQNLKALAKELDIPVIALSQLSRAVEQRSDKRPILSDLRESGSIEQDADVVMFIYREEYYLNNIEPKSDSIKYDQWAKQLADVHNIAEILIAKHRKGAIGNIKLYYESNYSKFSNLSN